MRQWFPVRLMGKADDKIKNFEGRTSNCCLHCAVAEFFSPNLVPALNIAYARP
jgi:hypothetical protein